MRTIKKSEVKELMTITDFDINEVREFLEDGDHNVFIGDYRIIHENDIDMIMQDELESDEWLLGCFKAEFLSDILGIDEDIFKAMQETESYEAIGKLILSMDKLEELQEEYVNLDGYGPHFSSYDGETIEFTMNNENYFIFRIN